MKISINLRAAVFTLHVYIKTVSGTTHTQHWNCCKDYIRTYTHSPIIIADYIDSLDHSSVVTAHTGSGTGPADPATTRPMFALWCLKG